MKIDNWNTLITHGPYPGCVGDSCAESARYMLAQKCIGYEGEPKLDLHMFRTFDGYIRHPKAPYGPPDSETSWREPDFTSDQALPLLMAYDVMNLGIYLSEMRGRVKWKTAPSKISSPGVMLVARQWYFLFGLTLFIQALIFKLPYRWSDDDRLKGKFWKWEKSEGSSADYLNFSSSLQFLFLKNYRLMAFVILWFVGLEKIKIKILSYYKDEPDYAIAVNPHFKALDMVDR